MPLLSSSTYGFFNNSISQNSKNVNTKNNTAEGVENVKYSIDKGFAKEYDNWDKKSDKISFSVGSTSSVLRKLGVDNKKITWDSSKIIKIKNKHPEMTDSIIKQVPNILENPIIVMESNTVSGRLVLFGDVYDSKNNPVLVALELNPTEKGGKSLNIIKIASAYGKDVDLQGFINKSKILYVEPNKERTHNWLSVNRLKLPLPSTRFGFFNNSISQNSKNVNTKNDESSNDIKYSMGGLKAETADKSALEKAMELEKDGTDSEKIRKETGWFKGYDGKWRFEIDNSELEFKTDIEKNRAAAIELAKMKVKSAELEEKIVNNTATKAEENEYYNLDEKMIEYRKGVKLSDVINHPKLFEAYPQLKNVDVYYEISSVNRGVYSSNGNVIMLNPMHTIDEQKEAIIHEIQHAIQGIENFANGSNLEYWKNLGYSDEEAMAMYYNTAGEREARDVSARRDYNAEQRKNIRPDIDRKDVVFANSGDAGYSADKDFTKYDNLETLDDKEIKVYNKRGWAYGLFNREDMKLLNEKFSELDRRLNSRTDNMLADGTRIVEVNNKIVSIGGTYNDPEIYSVLLINAENETYAEYVKEEILGYVNEQRNYSRRKYEEIWETTPFVYGEENIRHYNAYDYIYKKGGDDTGLRATLPGDFSRYGYNKESNIRGTSDANAKGEVSAVQLDEDTSDIKYATDDTINDWLDDESTPQGIDYEKAVEKNPVIAVAKIYKSAAQTAKSGLAQGKNVKLDEKEYLRIAGSIMQTYGIKGKYNPNYKKELASQLKNFVDSIGKKDANFTDLFEEL